jgi:hypothetical protein
LKARFFCQTHRKTHKKLTNPQKGKSFKHQKQINKAKVKEPKKEILANAIKVVSFLTRNHHHHRPEAKPKDN